MMDAEKFNERFSQKGGYSLFYKMVYNFIPHHIIARHFGFSKTTVRKYIDQLFGDAKPDSRKERRADRIDVILEYMKSHTEKESKQAFRKTNKEFLREALFLAHQQKIYED